MMMFKEKKEIAKPIEECICLGAWSTQLCVATQPEWQGFRAF